MRRLFRHALSVPALVGARLRVFVLGFDNHSLVRVRVLGVELARLHIIACRVYGLGPEAVLQGTRFRRCLLLFYIRRVGWSGTAMRWW